MLTQGPKAIDFKSVVRIDLHGHLQGQKAKNPTSLEQPNFGCSNEVPKFGFSSKVPKFGVSHENPKLNQKNCWLNVVSLILNVWKREKKTLLFELL